jgi:hypothetical protein
MYRYLVGHYNSTTPDDEAEKSRDAFKETVLYRIVASASKWWATS